VGVSALNEPTANLFHRVRDSDQLRELADAFERIRQQVSAEAADTVMDAVTQVAVALIPGVDWASITLLSGGRFRTSAATDERARQADQVQYELNAGPCVDAVLEGTLSYIGDTRMDALWPKFSLRVADEFGVGSMLSYRLNFDDATDTTIGGLNLYSLRTAVFDDDVFALGLLLAINAALAVGAAQNRRKAASLIKGLESNRDIGVAMGILMNAHKITRQQAFDLLRVASQHRHRKLHDIAFDVVDTGTLDLPTNFHRGRV
jgi:GAF domain-containing protein